MKRLSRYSMAIGALLFSFSTGVARNGDDAASHDPLASLPEGYRNWELVSVAHEAGMNNDIRAILGNDIAMKAFRDGVRPFPDGAIIARLAWQFQSSPRNDKVFPAPQSFVAGPATNVQISVKDARRYAATGGWGFGQFENGRRNEQKAVVDGCFACHAKLGHLEPGADLVFTEYSH